MLAKLVTVLNIPIQGIPMNPGHWYGVMGVTGGSCYVIIKSHSLSVNIKKKSNFFSWIEYVMSSLQSMWKSTKIRQL